MRLGSIQASDKVQLSWEDERIGVITLNDAANKNALDPEFVAALLAAFESAKNKETCSVLLLKAEGEFFCAGASLGLLNDLKDGEIQPDELGLTPIMLEHPATIIAVAEGHAIGGGMALLLAADFVFINRQSRYGLNFMVHGITPGMGVTALAEDFLGRKIAQNLLYTGDLKPGKFFEGSQFQVDEQSRIFNDAMTLAYAIAEKPPENVRLLKKTLNQHRVKKLQQALLDEQGMHRQSIKHLNTSFWGDL